MKNNSLGTKLLMAAVTLGLAAYFGFQAVRYFSDPLSTIPAYNYRVEEAVSVSGYVVRQEQVLPDQTGGVLQVRRAEGERVAVGGTVAAVYADQTSVDRQTEIEALNARIEQLQYALEAEVGVEVAQKLDTQIRRNILDYRSALTAGHLGDAQKQGAQLRAQVLKRDYTNTDTTDLILQIQELQAQVKDLKAQIAGAVQRITAPASGLYSAVVDGYESVLTPESILELTPSQLSGVKADSGTTSGVGKLVLGDSWYYVASMRAEEAQALEEAGELTLRFAKGVERDLPVTVAHVGDQENGRCVVVLQGRTYLAELTLLRQQSAQIISGSVEGIRVPEEALRVVTTTRTDEGGNTTESQVIGVYCVVGVEARFKPVEILYSGENFVLVRADQPSDKETLRLRPGDEVILSARDLSDGKVVAAD